MKFREHVKRGIFAYFIVLIPIIAWILYRENWSFVKLGQPWWMVEISVCAVLCILGAMTPDVDIKSKSQRIIYAILFLVILALILFMYYVEAAMIGFFAIFPNMLKHRHKRYGTHTLLWAIFLPAPLLIIPIFATGRLELQQFGVSYYISAVAGYISHLIADKPNNKGKRSKRRKKRK